MIELTNKNVGVTGSKGFIGHYVCDILKKRGAKVFGFEDKNILKDAICSLNYLRSNNIEYVIHLAGYNGGIEFNRLYPADVFAINTVLALNIVAASAHTPVKKLLSVVTSCSYPEKENDLPHKEQWLHQGPPNEVVACHGYAKRNLEIAGRMYGQQYGLKAITVCPNTVYGPGDRTDPNRTKVMTAIIKKFVDAKKTNAPEVECWGTGEPKREFIYVADAAELLVRALERYEGSIPLNISTGQEYTIKELSELVAQKVEYEGKITWDSSRPNGAMRKALDITQMKECLGDFEFTSIDKGIEETVAWYYSKTD